MQAESPSESGRWFGIAAGVLVGLVIGFAGGFVVAQRTEPIATPRSAAEPQVPAPPAAAPEPSGAPQTFTESPVAEPSAPAAIVEETPVAIDAPSSPPAGTSRAESAAAARTAPTPRRPAVAQTAPVVRPAPVERAIARNGSLQVASRPSGAQVYLDDVRVGTTPLTLGTVNEGRHRLRLELPGYRSWATSVDVTGEDQTRIGASLER